MNFYRLSKKKLFLNVSLVVFVAFFFVITNISAKLIKHEGKVTFLPNRKILKSLIKDIEDAKNSIYIAMYMFKTDDYKFNYSTLIEEAIFDALKKGVKVYAVFDIGKNDDITTRFNKDTGEELRKKGAIVWYDSPERKLHAKVVVIDNKIVYLGSHNYTHSAMKYNYETSVRIESSEMAQEVIKYIRGIR
ncbi:phospholipase D-like domain-containing protein [Deferribacter abyssi]|uniref:phospholipase D-like domain-containing protein n=1 Tax=Deferribacter abyssi TaxID=213806 RepID=UPI003C21A326